MFVPSIMTIVFIGLSMFLLLVFQVSLGMRWIKLQGRVHWKVHKWNGLTILGIATIHAILGLTLAGLIRLP